MRDKSRRNKSRVRKRATCHACKAIATIAVVTGSEGHKRLIPAIVGPTASGKSELGIKLALALDGEIINLDSVQVYCGIQIATAKVPPGERRGVPHHLIDVVEPTENFTAGEYARSA